ncbi:MAG TPA: hypothetical protein VL882_26420 [Vicinamibacterales bacterium]|nr:hypothetical protein [Vicinamibacterales bacterium]
MTRKATTTLAACVVLLGTANEARADCQYVHGSIAETRISLGTEPTRLLGTVTGVLNGAVTVTLLSLPPNVVRSLDIFVTKSGDVLRAEGLPTRTAIPGAPPGEFTSHVDLDIKGGFGKYEGAYGTMEFNGLSHTAAVPPNSETVYKGTVCGPNIKAGDGH